MKQEIDTLKARVDMIDQNVKTLHGILGGSVDYRGVIHILDSVETEIEEAKKQFTNIDVELEKIDTELGGVKDKMIYHRGWLFGVGAAGTALGGIIVYLSRAVFKF